MAKKKKERNYLHISASLWFGFLDHVITYVDAFNIQCQFQFCVLIKPLHRTPVFGVIALLRKHSEQPTPESQ